MSQNNPTGGSTPGTTGTGGAGSTAGGGAGGGTSSSPGTGQSLTPSSSSSGGGQGTGAATGLAAQAQEYGKKVADAASTAKDYVADKMTPVIDRVKDLQNTDVREVANQAKDYARQNPGQAILISAAAGLVLGLLIRGSRR
jgi:ElaB/YqjD/DUF883 family membrane-anchored ribosome-binding protein